MRARSSIAAVTGAWQRWLVLAFVLAAVLGGLLVTRVEAQSGPPAVGPRIDVSATCSGGGHFIRGSTTTVTCNIENDGSSEDPYSMRLSTTVTGGVAVTSRYVSEYSPVTYGWTATIGVRLNGSGSLSATFTDGDGDKDTVTVDFTTPPPVTPGVTPTNTPTPTPTRTPRPIQPSNRAPNIDGGPTRVSYREDRTTAVGSYTATDPDRDNITWSLNGVDENRFSISSGGVLTFSTQPNFEAPADTGSNNEYNVAVVATDDGSPRKSATRPVVVIVTDYNFQPTIATPIPDQTLRVGQGNTNIDLSNKFSDVERDKLRYTASSSETSVATVNVSLSESSLEITPVAAGMTTVKVTAYDRASGIAGGMSVFQEFTVTVQEPEIEITGLAASRQVNEDDVFAVRATGLDPLTDYTITVTTSSSNARFSDCSTTPLTTQQDISVPSRSTWYDTSMTLYACSGGYTTVTATLGGSSPEKVATQRTAVLPVLTASTIAAKQSDGTTIVVNYSLPSDDFYYQATLVPTSQTTPIKLPLETMSIDAFTPSESGVYRVAIRVCLDEMFSDCGSYVESMNSLTKLNPAVIRDVTPLSLRRAVLSWDLTPVETGVKYVVQAREAGGAWQYPTFGDVASGTTWQTSYEIDLDAVLTTAAATQRGLAHADRYEFKVKVSDESAMTLDSVYSAAVTLIDNPIVDNPFEIEDNPMIDNPSVTNGGMADGFSTGGDQADLQWARITEAGNGYSVKYRMLGAVPIHAGVPYPIPHSDWYWPVHEDWPYYAKANLPDPILVGQPVGETVTATMTGLRKEGLYAIQVNYVTPLLEKKVFSARDAYVWPSDGHPVFEERVATYTFFGHHENREYKYIICDASFPQERIFPLDPNDTRTKAENWVTIIYNAFEGWETATDGYISMTPDFDTPCADRDSPIAEFIVEDDERNEVRMVEVDDEDRVIFEHHEIRSDVFKTCLHGNDACTTSFTGYVGVEAVEQTRMAIKEEIGKYIAGQLDYRELRRVLKDAILSYPLSDYPLRARNIIQGVDVSFNRGQIGAFPPNIPRAVAFNTCMQDAERTLIGTDDSYRPYSVAVHEAGHALGLSWYNIQRLDQVYEEQHPTIPDSVMNYDKPGPIRYPNLEDGFDEPDCSPHPFDVLAIYALYQAVP